MKKDIKHNIGLTWQLIAALLVFWALVGWITWLALEDAGR